MQMWHGGRRWLGGPEIKEPRARRAEGGPGIYLTNKYLRASSYAKGGGVTILVDIKDEVVLSDSVMIDIHDVSDFLDRVSRLRNRKALTRDLLHDVITGDPRESISGRQIVNLFVNHEAGTGRPGVDLAEFLVEHGIDASLDHATGDEEWMVIHNPKVIDGWRVMSASEVDAMDDRNLEPPSEYLKRIAAPAPGM